MRSLLSGQKNLLFYYPLLFQTLNTDPHVTHFPLFLAGPTASGKSALAVLLAEKLNGEIINADAFQLYNGMPICTAQPDGEALQRAQHHLYAVLALHETCDAARYAEMAKAAIAEVQARAKLPIVVGGSGLYIKALTHGLSDLPSDESLREELAQLTAEERVTRLLALDPLAAETVNLRNDRYVSRALEICLLTGQPQSALRQAWKQAVPPDFNGILLHWQRPELNQRIAQRTHMMVQAGLIEEIASLPPLSSTADRAIGVREVREHLAGQITVAQMTEAIEIATRQYARRQDKWFRREKGFKVLEMHGEMSAEQTLDSALALLSSAAGEPVNPLLKKFP